jgi:hypothetical protein
MAPKRKRTVAGIAQSTRCSGLTDFQLAVFIRYHDDDFRWINDDAITTVMLRLQFTRAKAQVVHKNFQTPKSDCHGGYPMPQQILNPVTGLIAVADISAVIMAMMQKIKPANVFRDCESSKIAAQYVIMPPIAVPAQMNKKQMKEELSRRNQLFELLTNHGLFEQVYNLASGYMHKKTSKGMCSYFHECHGETKLPSQCFVNYYPFGTKIMIPKHRDRVPFCSVTVSLTEDDGCLSIYTDGSDKPYPVTVGSYVMYDRVHHLVISNAPITKARCTINFFF